MIYNSVLKGRQGEEGINEEYRKAESMFFFVQEANNKRNKMCWQARRK